MTELELLYKRREILERVIAQKKEEISPKSISPEIADLENPLFCKFLKINREGQIEKLNSNFDEFIKNENANCPILILDEEKKHRPDWLVFRFIYEKKGKTNKNANFTYHKIDIETASLDKIKEKVEKETGYDIKNNLSFESISNSLLEKEVKFLHFFINENILSPPNKSDDIIKLISEFCKFSLTRKNLFIFITVFRKVELKPKNKSIFHIFQIKKTDKIEKNDDFKRINEFKMINIHHIEGLFGDNIPITDVNIKGEHFIHDLWCNEKLIPYVTKYKDYIKEDK